MVKFSLKDFFNYFITVILVFLFIIYLIINPIFFYKKTPNNIFVDKEALSIDVKTLTKINPPRNHLNINSLNQAADYIYSEFKKTGCQLDVQKYIIDNKEYKNIICSFGIDNTERLIVGAHYDVYSNTPGADDNASGIAGILGLARIIAQEKQLLTHRLDLIAYTLEEPPYFRTDNMGSFKHAQYLKENNIKIKGMLSLEMIGFFSDKKNSQNYPAPIFNLIYPNEANFIAVIGKFGQQSFVKKIKKNMLQNSNIIVKSINTPTAIKGMDFSDHLNYWNLGYDAVMISDSSFYRNPNYHLNNDTYEKLNFHKMAEVIRGVYFTILHF